MKTSVTGDEKKKPTNQLTKKKKQDYNNKCNDPAPGTQEQGQNHKIRKM